MQSFVYENVSAFFVVTSGRTFVMSEGGHREVLPRKCMLLEQVKQ